MSAPEPKRTIAVRGLRSIRLRLALLASLVALGTAGAVGLVFEHFYGAYSFDDARERSATVLESLAVPCAMNLARGSMERLDDNLEELVKAGQGGSLGVLEVGMADHRGRLLLRSEPGGVKTSEHLADVAPGFLKDATHAQVPIWRRIERDRVPAVVVSMPAVSGLRWGTLYGVFDLRPVFAKMRTARWVMLGFALALAAVLAIALNVGLSRLVIRPVRVMEAAVLRMQEGDLAARVEVDSVTELGALAKGMNSMAAELERHTAHLEHLVEERTEEVRAKNTELEEVNRRLEEAVGELARLAKIDGLTHIFNRRHFFELLDFELRRGQRTTHPMALLMADIDHFKEVNDTYGHQAGDEVLRGVAGLLADSIRSTDILARYGGEEFVLMLLDTERSAGLTAAQKLREAVEGREFTSREGSPICRVTISIGVTQYPEDGLEVAGLIEKADQALYAAKAAGRNRVVGWTPELGQSTGRTR